MNRFVVVAAAVIVVLSASTSRAQEAGRIANPSLQQLDEIGPGGLIYVPRNLEEVVKLCPAAVIARIRGFAPVSLREARSPGGKMLGHNAETRYQVHIVDVLYNRLSANAPPLLANTDAELTKTVGRDEAKAFVANQTTLLKDDECILFLWHHKASPEWSMVDWPYQLRRSKKLLGEAEALDQGAAQWLSATTAMTQGTDRIAVSWNSIVSEVRRVGRITVPPGPPRN